MHLVFGKRRVQAQPREFQILAMEAFLLEKVVLLFILDLT